MGYTVSLPDVSDTRPMPRTVERVLLYIAGAWNLLNASITLFVYSNWFRGESYTLLEEEGLLDSTLTNVNSVVYVVQIYGLIVAMVGVVSIVIASRAMRPSAISKPVQIYLAVLVVFSLATGDWLALVLYSICCAVYAARSVALRKASKNNKSNSK